MPDPADSQTKNLRKKSAALSIGAANRKVGKIMVNFLMKIVSFFLPQGDVSVSESDLRTYITMLQGYIIFILLAIAAVIVVMIVAHKAKKGFRHIIRWEAVLAFVLAIVVCANMICYGPMYSTVSVALNGGKKNVSEETAASTREFVSRVGDEGITLVKNEGLLPLKSDVTKLNVFGWASANPVFTGSGSGSVAGEKMGILESLAQAGYTTNTTLTDMYTEYGTERPAIGMYWQDFSLPEPTMDHYTNEIMNEAKAFSDVAVIVLGRGGGEGADMATDMGAVIDGSTKVAEQVSVVPQIYGYANNYYKPNGDYDEFEKGQNYQSLSKTERLLIDKVCSEFNDVIVIVNSCGAMELQEIQENSKIKAVLLAPPAGSTGFSAVGRILKGEVNPSGRTVDIYPASFTTAPNFNNIGRFNYTNVKEECQQIAAVDTGFEGAMSFVNYVEGIYVGYRYYETAAAEGFIDYDEQVVYPFGYGLSYTTFDRSIANYKDNGDTVSFDVNVTNTGSVAGKDVVEIYFTPPYYNGGIEKSEANLIEFGKTSLLEPGKSETISFALAKEDMASYDSDQIKVKGGGYILEAGEYTISLRSDSHNVIDEVSFTVDSDIDYSKTGRASDDTPAVNHMDDARGTFEQLSRKDSFANFDTATAAPTDEDYIMSDEIKAKVMENAVGFYDGTKYNKDGDTAPTLGAKNGKKLADMRGLSYDDPAWEPLLDQLSFEDMVNMINTGGWQTIAVDSVGMVATAACDGPSGLSNFVAGKSGTPMAPSILLAQTWSKELASEYGEKLAVEFKELDTAGMYGPGLNTHRSAFGGRNYEYLSEDPVLAGMLVSAEVNALAEGGIVCYTKHIGLNDQETNRCAFLLTNASEQAAREIYLKPYEILTKQYTGVAQGMMSSFNWIGTTPSCAYSPILNDIMRGEWGFRGAVITDYDGSYGAMITDNCVRNGGDLKLGFYTGGGSIGLTVNTTAMTDQHPTILNAMRTSCKNIMFVVVNSIAYGEDANLSAMSRMDKLFVTINVTTGVVIAGAEILLFLNYKKKRKAAEK